MNLNYIETKFQRADEIEIPDTFFNRIKTGNETLDDFFGDGILPGSSFTVTAKPGAGKSTFLLQLSQLLVKQGYSIGYTSGEESFQQIGFTCRRLGVKDVEIANISEVETLVEYTKMFDMIIIDSFQALKSKDNLRPKALEKFAIESLYMAGQQNTCVIGFVCHLTKTGQMKGGTLVPHTVDMNMQIEVDDIDNTFRNISIYKNRFGGCNEIQLTFGARGYDFSSGIEINSINKNITKTDNEKYKDQILALDHINIVRVTEIAGDVNKANRLLNELVTLSILKKFGRGPSAVWCKPDEI